MPENNLQALKQLILDCTKPEPKVRQSVHTAVQRLERLRIALLAPAPETSGGAFSPAVVTEAIAAHPTAVDSDVHTVALVRPAAVYYSL